MPCTVESNGAFHVVTSETERARRVFLLVEPRASGFLRLSEPHESGAMFQVTVRDISGTLDQFFMDESDAEGFHNAMLDAIHRTATYLAERAWRRNE